MRDALQVGDLGVRELGAHALEHGRDLDPDRNLGVQRADVAGERVAAEQREAVIGRRADDQDPLAGGVLERQRAVVVRAAPPPARRSRRASARSSSVSSVIRPRTASGSSRSASAKPSGSGVPVGVEQPELELLPQHAPQRGVDHLDVDAAGLDLGGERLAVGVDGRQLDVDAGGQRGDRGLAIGAGDAVQGAQEGDAEVVGDDRAVEAPGLAQQAGEQLAIGGRGDAVDVGVGAHHAARRPTRGPPSRTAAPSRRRTRAVPSRPGARLRPALEAE